MQNTIEVINITTDIYDLTDIIKDYYKEQGHGNYYPIIHMRSVTVHDKPRIAFTIVRLPNESDLAFVKTQKARTHITYPFVSKVECDDLYYIGSGGTLKHFFGEIKR